MIQVLQLDTRSVPGKTRVRFSICGAAALDGTVGWLSHRGAVRNRQCSHCVLRGRSQRGGWWLGLVV